MNQQYVAPLANILKLEEGIEDDHIKQLYLNNPLTISYWFQSKKLDIDNQLTFNQSELIYLTQLSVSQPFFALEYTDEDFELSPQFIIMSPYLIKQIPQSLNDLNCQIDIQQKFDLNCFEWFQQAKIQENYFYYSKVDNDRLSQTQQTVKSFFSCKKIFSKQLNSTNNKEQNVIMCYQVYLNLNDNMFQIIQGDMNIYNILYFHINKEEIINNYSQYICQNQQTEECLQQQSFQQQLSIFDQSFKNFQEVAIQNIFDNQSYKNEQSYQDESIQIQTQPEDVKELIIIEDKIFGDLKAEDIFGSRDTLTLYESLKNLIKMLKYRQQNIFLENSCKTLLSMNIQTQFFKRFTNYQELGILYNNIANIHFFEQRYLEALENYQNSIICAKIQLQYYQETTSKKNLHSYYQTSIVCSIKPKRKSVASLFENKNLTLVENLFNRKYNYYKCLLAYYEKQGFSNVLWEELEQLLNELDNLGSFLEFSHGRNIFLELEICFIKYSTNNIQQAKIQLEKVKKVLELKEELDLIQIRSKDQNNFDHERVYATKIIQRYQKVKRKNIGNQIDFPSEQQNSDLQSQIKRKKKQSYSKLVKNYKEERENYNQIQFLKYFASQKKVSLQNISNLSQNTIKQNKQSNFQKMSDSKTKQQMDQKIQTVKTIQNNSKQENQKQFSFNLLVYQERQKAQSQFIINNINKDQKIEEDTNLHKKQLKPLNYSCFNKQVENKERFSFQARIKEDSKEIESCPKYSLTSIQNIEPKNQEKQMISQHIKKLIKFQKIYKKVSFFKDIDQRLIQNYDYPFEIMKSYYTIIESQILMKEGFNYQAAKMISKSLKNSTCYQTHPKQKLLRFLNSIFKQNMNFEFEPLKKQINGFNEITIFKISLFVFCQQDINKYISYQICQEIIDQVMTNQEDSLGVLAYLQDISDISQLDEIMQILPPIKKSEINNNREFVEDNLVLLLDFLQEKEIKQREQTKYSYLEIFNPPILKKNISNYSKYSGSPKSIYSNSPLAISRKQFQSFDSSYEQNEKRQSYGNFCQLNNTPQDCTDDACQISNLQENIYSEKSKSNTLENYHNQSIFLQSSLASSSKNTQNNNSYLESRFSVSSKGMSQQYNNSKFMAQDSILNESDTQLTDGIQSYQNQSEKQITAQIQEKKSSNQNLINNIVKIQADKQKILTKQIIRSYQLYNFRTYSEQLSPPIVMILLQYNILKDKVTELSQSVFQTQIEFSKSLNKASFLNLNNQLQEISIQAYVLRKQLFKLSDDKYNYNLKYVPLMLNQELIYQNKEDPIKTQIALQNEYYASNWYSDQTLIYNELDGLSQIELVRNDRLNYILRAYVHQYLNQQNSTLNLGYQIFAFNSNGVFFSNYMNTTFSNQVDDPKCPKTKYPFNTRCRFWYLASKESPGLVVYPPLPILSFYGQQQLVNLICQRTLDKSKQLYAVFCDYMFVDDLKKFFRGYQNIKTHQIIFDPQSFVAIYDSRQDLDISKTTKLQDLLQKSIGHSKQLKEFYKMIQQKYSNRQIKTEKRLDFTDTITSNQFQQEYNIKDDHDNNYLVIFNLLFTVEKLDSDVDNDNQSYNSTFPNKFNYITIYILMDILSEKELMSFSQQILDKLKIVFILTIVIFGLLLIVVVCIILQYSIIFSHMIEYPIDRLIKIFNNIQLNLDDINEFIIAQNTQFLDQQSEFYSIFYSEDTRLLYESFTSLVKMLRYSALNLLKEDPSENLLNLNLQINFFDKFQNKRSLGICHNNLANIHFLQGRYLEALDHYERSIIYAYEELNIYQEDNGNQSKSQQQRLSKFLNLQRQTTQTKTSLNQNQKKKADTSYNLSQTQQDQGLKRKDMNEMLQSRIEKQELIENLFNRKFNMFKCLNTYYQQEISIQKQQNPSNQNIQFCQDLFYIEELISLANDLLKISSKLQDENLSREIILRIYILEYQLILNELKQAEIQYDIIKNLFDRKYLDEQDNIFALEQSVRGQSFIQVRNKNQSAISQYSDKCQQNRASPPLLKKETKQIPFIIRQNNIIKETTSILFNKSIDKKLQNNQIDQKIQTSKNSAIIKLKNINLPNQIDEKETVQNSSMNLEKKFNNIKTEEDDENQEINYIKIDKESKTQLDEIGLEIKTRNSIQSNQNLLAQFFVRGQKNIATLNSPQNTNEKSPKNLNIYELNTYRKASEDLLLEQQANNKNEQSQFNTQRLTQVLFQNVGESVDKNESYSNYNTYKDDCLNLQKQDQQTGNIYKNFQLTNKRISYAIDSSPNTKPIKRLTTQQVSNFQKIVNKRFSQQIELKNLAYDFNCDILQSFMAIAKAKFLLAQGKTYEAINVLTQSLEDQKYYSYKGKFQVLQLVQSIFAENNLHSKQLYSIIDKFQQKRLFKIAVVVCCSKQKNREISHWIINEIIQNILLFQEDGLGVIKYRFGESHFQQLFKLFCKSQISQNYQLIQNQLQEIINYKQEDQNKEDILIKTCNCFSSTFSLNKIDDEEDENLKCQNNNQYNHNSLQLYLGNKLQDNIFDANFQPSDIQQKLSKNILNSTCRTCNISITERLYQNNQELMKQFYFNKLFHLCIRNAVNNIFFNKSAEQIEYSKLNQIKQNNLNKKKTKKKNKQDLLCDFSICKYIVLIIDKPYIDFDDQFQHLNSFLQEMRIKLLILQLNDIECQQEKTSLEYLKHDQRLLIKQFFSADKLLRYLYEQRINNKQLQVDYNIEFY
ncbi:tetratricopeptide repeat protein (macronuclear) [Tetrahymena thermophila SB210]|uniref:Tetratricopeptide repeat protein n=1 Tax=Tetrahymena thermophila (strain SB210) TaxID=312017 RepID=Q245R1_TETTS|nr:tetratricopeptide repeat protein [Tetrahymena thermophila SB210]EAS03572.2 tetratricopeptide repeat protein [Tetrahymena thermophila SB210]|eukprot:XP_001023817.2 tetratricopeptide repeat protein [Tetrahymena thermophila SB210]